jgi:hypothetical protein
VIEDDAEDCERSDAIEARKIAEPLSSMRSVRVGRRERRWSRRRRRGKLKRAHNGSPERGQPVVKEATGSSKLTAGTGPLLATVVSDTWPLTSPGDRVATGACPLGAHAR